MKSLTDQYRDQIEGLVDEELKKRNVSEEWSNKGLRAALGIELAFQMRKAIPVKLFSEQETFEHARALHILGHDYQKASEEASAFYPPHNTEAFEEEVMNACVVDLIDQLSGYTCTVDEGVKLDMQMDYLNQQKEKETGMHRLRGYGLLIQKLSSRKAAILKIRNQANQRSK